MTARIRTGGVALAVVAMMMMATPASAEWYVYISLGSVEPTNAAMIAAGIETATSGPSTFDESIRFLEPFPDAELTGRIGVGWKAGDGVVGISWWGYSGDDTVSATLDDVSNPSIVIDDSMTGEFFGPEVGTVSAFGEIEASIIDLGYYMRANPGGGKIHTTYNFGITAVNFEETILLAAAGDDVGGGFPETLDEIFNLDVSGFGFAFGGGAEYEVNDRFSLYGRMNARFVMADVDELLDGTEADPFFSDRERIFDDRDASGLIWDMAAGAKVYKSDLVEVGIEYNLSSWSDLVQRQTFGAEDPDDPHTGTRNNVSFHGFAITTLWRFGGDN